MMDFKPQIDMLNVDTGEFSELLARFIPSMYSEIKHHNSGFHHKSYSINLCQLPMPHLCLSKLGFV